MKNDVIGRSSHMKRVQCIGMQIYDVFQEQDGRGNPSTSTIDADDTAPNRLPGTESMAIDTCVLTNQLRADAGFPSDGQRLTLHASHFFNDDRRSALTLADDTGSGAGNEANQSISAKVEQALRATQREAVDTHTAIPATVDIEPPTVEELNQFAVPALGGDIGGEDLNAYAGTLSSPLSTGAYDAERHLCRLIKRAYSEGEDGTDLNDPKYECTREEVSVTGALWGASRIYHDTKFLQNVADKGRGRFDTWFDETGHPVNFNGQKLNDAGEPTGDSGNFFASRTASGKEEHQARLIEYYDGLRGGSRLLVSDVAENKLINQGKLREKMACAMTFTVRNAVESATGSSVGPEITAMAQYVNGIVCSDQLGGLLR